MTAGARPSFYLKTLGELSLHAEGPRGPPLLRNSKPLAVLAYLATASSRSARRDHVAQLLWPESDPSHARSSLRQALFYISQRVGRTLIQTDDSVISLDASLVTVDIWEFERELESGDYAHVVELYAGPFVPGLERKAGAELEGWIESQDERLRAGLEVAYTRLIANWVASGAADNAVAYARRYVELNPLNERAQLALIRALKAADDQIGALQAYRSFRSLLREALDGEPSEELERAVASVRDEVLREPSLDEIVGPATVQPGRRILPWAVAGSGFGATAALVAIIIALQGWWPWGNGETSVFDELSGDLYVHVGPVNSPGLARAEVRRGTFSFEATTYPYSAIPSPDGNRVALQVAANDGRNLAVVDRASASTRTLTRAAHDELQQGWSPDGRFILYRQGKLLEEGEGYNHDLMAYDLQAEREILISDMRARKAYDAAWSPDGTRIAFVAEPADERQLYVAHADGSNPIGVADGLVEHGQLAWSQNGRHIAFVVADQSGNGDIFTVHPDGSELRQLTESGTLETSPFWFSEDLLGFVMKQPDGRSDVWVLDVRGGPAQRLTERGDIRAVVAYAETGAPQSWIDRVSISPAIGTVTPGQYLSIDVQAVDANGRPVEPAGLPVRWSLSDSTLASFASPNLLSVQATGSALLVVSVGGWVEDTLEIHSREIVEGPVTLLLFEDWSRGINGERWIRWGDPLPEARPTGGPEGAGIFVNNGDHHYSSGAASRQAFSPREGLTVEFWGSMPLTGKLYETFAVGLAADVPDDSAEWDALSSDVEFVVEGSLLEMDSAAVLKVHVVPFYLPPLPTPERWHHYALQLDRDGLISFLIDGRLFWRLPSDLPVQEMPPLHIVLGRRSLDNEIAHGLLRVYYGSKYLLPNSSPSP